MKWLKDLQIHYRNLYKCLYVFAVMISSTNRVLATCVVKLCCQASCWEAMRAVGDVGKSEISSLDLVSVVSREMFRFQVMKRLQTVL